MDVSEQIRHAQELIAEVDDGFIENGVATHSIAVRTTPSGEVVIEANRAGLVHLASSLLTLAAGSVSGGHYHLDENGMADEAEVPVVFCYKLAEWD